MVAAPLPPFFCLNNGRLLIRYSGIRGLAVKFITQSLPTLLLLLLFFLGSSFGEIFEKSWARHCIKRKAADFIFLSIYPLRRWHGCKGEVTTDIHSALAPSPDAQ